ncbi:uncharacterized protein EDB93DRAFT_1339961 [Suillus bovinus]|uniref:uncharacterized protein n=1 Tax=Suillus bovinus TaxID=48563 RepID=UPI001B8815F6|nr:uncharacterized protein EDB93DRAFT_1339961 [Suillus bovinus]KAG2133554.1 hypothetical protein EDB93DRAFT_1339961 [Suillus bovinus]
MSIAQGVSGAPPSVSATLPPEFWQMFALHFDLPDVLTLGLVSKLCREEMPKNSLQAASFSAARAVITATVSVGQDAEATQSGVVYFPLLDTWLRVPISGTLPPGAREKTRANRFRGSYHRIPYRVAYTVHVGLLSQ